MQGVWYQRREACAFTQSAQQGGNQAEFQGAIWKGFGFKTQVIKSSSMKVVSSCDIRLWGQM